MTTKTVVRVLDEYRTWDGPNGTLAFIKLHFDDGSHGDVATRVERAEQRIAELKALEGKSGEFELEDKGEYQGVPQFKVRSWPGKEPYRGGGGGGGQAAFRNTAEGQRIEQDAMNRRTALMQAVTLVPGGLPPDVLQVSEALYRWLSAALPPSAHMSAAEPGGARDAAAPPTSSGIQSGTGQFTSGLGNWRVSSGTTQPQGEGPVPDRQGSGKGDGEAPAPGPCHHTRTAPTKPDGRKLPAGRARCLDCGLIVEEGE